MPSDLELTSPQRAAAIERAGENLALRSGAGCGKTFVLARRYVELLSRCGEPDSAVRRLVALTFTEKAALEMSVRVREMLAGEAASASGPRRRRLLAWLDELPEARISTIHGFCASLLRTGAIEAGVDPSFAVAADELMVEQMLTEAVEKALLAAVEQQREDVLALLVDVTFDRLLELVKQLLEGRTGYEASEYTDVAATLERWRRVLESRRAEWLSDLRDPAVLAERDELADWPCGDAGDKLAAFRDAQLAAVAAILSDPAGAPAGSFDALSAKPGNIGSARNWGGKEALQAYRRRLCGLIEHVREHAVFCRPLDEADRRAAAALAALAALAAEARGLYAAEKRRRGLLDFTDLLDLAAKLLARRDDVRRSLGGQIDQLLIDECQDTNRFQLELLEMLIGGGRGGGRPADGRLFAVGDAKQSIYRFRGAQVEVFEDLCARLGADHQETLGVSYRTHEAGIEFVNHLFAPLMGPDYEPIEAHRKVCPPGPAVEVLLAADDEEQPVADSAAATRAQAAVTAHRIRQMLDEGERTVWDREAASWRPVRAGDIAVLFARMTVSPAYERELQRRGVPYYVVAGTGFFQQQEVFDVLNALAAIDNPADDPALFGALRSSLFGLDDNVLMHVAEACDPPYFAALAEANLSGRLDGSREGALRFALDLIGRLHRQKDAVSIGELVEGLLAETGYEAALLSQFQGRRMASNVRMVAERARSAGSQGVALADFIAEMRSLVLAESRYEQAAVAGEGEDVVRLLTIHKAKGLEFPVVFVPDLNAGRQGAGGRLLLRDDWGLTFKSPQDDEDGGGTAFRIAKWLEDADGRKEDVRRLYVAATRHEDRLVLVGADWRSKTGGLRQSDSYLAAIDGVLAVAAAVEAGREEVGYGRSGHVAAVRRVVAPPPQPSGRGQPPGRKLLEAASSGADLGERLGKTPRARGELPLVGPVAADVGLVEIAVTALNDFGQCPMMYRWRHELRVPTRGIGDALRGDGTVAEEARERGSPGLGGDSEGASSVEGGVHSLDAATLGTLYHRCMELLDPRRPQPAAALVRQAAGEMELTESVDLTGVEAELAEMLASFEGHELFGRLRAARQALRELDFVMRCGPAVLRGQIDLLLEEADGAWRVVDYKSDRADEQTVVEHAAGYELQLSLYAAAAGRHVSERPAGATLYFLRPALTHEFSVAPADLEAAERRAAGLARELITARRSGHFELRRTQVCRRCPYAPLCNGR